MTRIFFAILVLCTAPVHDGSLAVFTPGPLLSGPFGRLVRAMFTRCDDRRRRVARRASRGFRWAVRVEDGTRAVRARCLSRRERPYPLPISSFLVSRPIRAPAS